jgi:peptidoglycan hydrolase CwlO-like protein
MSLDTPLLPKKEQEEEVDESIIPPKSNSSTRLLVIVITLLIGYTVCAGVTAAVVHQENQEYNRLLKGEIKELHNDISALTVDLHILTRKLQGQKSEVEVLKSRVASIDDGVEKLYDALH